MTESAGTPPQRTVVILQPSYLPWLGALDQVRRANVFVFYDDVQFDRRGWRNRNRIRGPAEAQWLTVPVLTRGKFHAPICEVEIDPTQPWQRRHLRALHANYGRAPGFAWGFPRIEQLLSHSWTRIAELAIASTRLLAEAFGVQGVEYRRSSELGVPGRKTERLLAICRRLGATSYLTGDAARAYLDEGAFAAAGIRVQYQHYRHPIYPQHYPGFVGHLSAVDCLLCCGAGAGEVMRSVAGPWADGSPGAESGEEDAWEGRER